MSKEYYTTPAGVSAMLDAKGLAILPKFLTEKECEEMEEGFWKTFEHLTGGVLDRDDPATWRSVIALQPTQGMLFQTYGIGQAQVSWDLRQKKKIIDVFRDVYEDDDLTVSMDGLAFSLPPEVTNCGWAVGPDNTHVDQSLFDNSPHWVQGWVTAKDVHEGDATFSFLPGSHLRHKEFREYKEAGGSCGHATVPGAAPKETCSLCESFHAYKGGSDWYVLTPEDLEFFGELERVQCPAGSMIIWDSRLFHSGSRPKRGRANESTRMVSYITYYPKSWMEEKQQRYHLETFTKGHTSTHHFLKRFPMAPRLYGPPKEDAVAVPLLPAPILNDIGKELLRFDLQEPIEKFIAYCEEHGAYPTATADKSLNSWFVKEKKKAKADRTAVDSRLHELFESETWYNQARPVLR